MQNVTLQRDGVAGTGVPVVAATGITQPVPELQIARVLTL
jgi:hypothetical protein